MRPIRYDKTGIKLLIINFTFGAHLNTGSSNQIQKKRCPFNGGSPSPYSMLHFGSYCVTTAILFSLPALGKSPKAMNNYD